MAKLSNQDLNNMFGCDIETFTGLMKDSITYKLSGGAMVIAGLLSDVQEQIHHGNNEGARQTLNCAKALLFDALDGTFNLLPERN
jgi:hypothetical protein